ncbi:hypothetical protein EYM_07430 [Ignicoccus islandicus DSM 13165]|uniref:Uncharacterized protein n=1 Tax=Ignicoccus islandicus DSM 13165 TaxID=940295 RepID=A0A0U3DYW8_9CREN|nr:hypothetical protein [Ignicoccus islandicus]ALU12778.1 hypothetical protein EYM_07430 [Ignicoccus islandicus DSM 13165]
MRYLKVFLLLTLLSATIFSIKCVSNYEPLQERCTRVAIEVEELWGYSDAIVYLVNDTVSFVSGVPESGVYELHIDINMEEILDCILAHELTHVLQLERGLRSQKWFLEGQADLSCYLLYPNEYKFKGYIEWVTTGYGNFDPYFFGITTLYFILKSKGIVTTELWKYSSLSFNEALGYFVKALSTCEVPFGVCPKAPMGAIYIKGSGWAKGTYYIGEGARYGSIIILRNGGMVINLPQPSVLSIFIIHRIRNKKRKSISR